MYENPYTELPPTKTNQHLAKLRLNLPTIRVSVHDGYDVYKTSWGNSIGAAKFAQQKINELKLDLVIENKITEGLANDCFTVKGKGA